MGPVRAKIIKSQRRDFRGKKLGFCSGETAIWDKVKGCASGLNEYRYHVRGLRGDGVKNPWIFDIIRI